MDTIVGDVGDLPKRSLLALIWTSFSIAAVFVGLRTGIRFKVADRLTPEDYWMFMALATLISLCILETIQLPSPEEDDDGELISQVVLCVGNDVQCHVDFARRHGCEVV